MDDLRAELSWRQSEVLDFVLAHIGFLGFPPSYREIGQALGIDSTNAVSGHVKGLIRKGYLAQSGPRGAPRSLQPTDKARRWAASGLTVVHMVKRAS